MFPDSSTADGRVRSQPAVSKPKEAFLYCANASAGITKRQKASASQILFFAFILGIFCYSGLSVNYAAARINGLGGLAIDTGPNTNLNNGVVPEMPYGNES